MRATPDDLVAQTVLIRPTYEGALGFSEAPADARCFERVLNGVEARVFTAGNRDAVLEVVEKCGRAGIPGVFGIIDRDFEPPDWRPPTNVIATPGTDLEMTVVKSLAFDAFLEEFASKTKIERACAESDADGARHLVAREASKIGVLRRWNHDENLGLDFKELNFKKALDDRTLELNEERVARTLATSRVGEAELVARMHSAVSEVGDSWEALQHVCNGHDFMEIFSRGLRRLLGSHSTLTTDFVASAMLLGFTPRHLMDVSLGGRLDAWGSSSGYSLAVDD